MVPFLIHQNWFTKIIFKIGGGAIPVFILIETVILDIPLTYRFFLKRRYLLAFIGVVSNLIAVSCSCVLSWFVIFYL